MTRLRQIDPRVAADAGTGEMDAPRKRPVQREHKLQAQVAQFVEDAVALPGGPDGGFLFLSFDTARKATQNERAREAARGIRRGTLDTMIQVAGRMPVWIELKHGNGPESEAQERMGRLLRRLGNAAEIARSVAEYCAILRKHGVPLVTNAEYLALHRDGKVATNIAREDARLNGAPLPEGVRPAKKRAAPRARKPGPAPAALKVAARARAKGIFW